MRRQRGLINSKELSIQSITVLVVVFAKTESSSQLQQRIVLRPSYFVEDGGQKKYSAHSVGGVVRRNFVAIHLIFLLEGSPIRWPS